ncbi:MAG: hypothetical protein PHD48_04500 [Alphaproteobacteria bacterium]|nr:hypothetical protein [Alphaproteobacteria bacterium]
MLQELKDNKVSRPMKNNLWAMALKAVIEGVSTSVTLVASITILYYAPPVLEWGSQFMTPVEPFVPTLEEKQIMGACKEVFDTKKGEVSYVDIVDRYCSNTGEKFPVQYVGGIKRAVTEQSAADCTTGFGPPPRETLKQITGRWNYVMSGSPHSVYVVGR